MFAQRHVSLGGLRLGRRPRGLTYGLIPLCDESCGIPFELRDVTPQPLDFGSLAMIGLHALLSSAMRGSDETLKQLSLSFTSCAIA
ncbi:MAG: hypothetical protein EXR39_15015 [Betaproteobacteria bacterium]|nr:hypothetical protein [Betaproteobacteria bacterium]